MTAFFTSVLLVPITLYRWLISPLSAGCCRFHPSCSAYSQQALKTHGIAKGLMLTARRIVRCHPWGGSGLDPVPTKEHTHEARN